MSSQFYTDFGGYSVGNIASTPDWSVLVAGGGNWTQTIAAKSGAVSANVAQINRSSSGDAPNLVVNSTMGATTGDIETLTQFMVHGLNNGSYWVGAGLAAPNSNGSSTGGGYGIAITSSTGWALGRMGTSLSYGTGGGTALQGFTSPFTFVVDTWYWLRMGRAGSTIRSKIWQGSLGAEPGGPTGWSGTGIVLNQNGGNTYTATDTTFSSVEAAFAMQDHLNVPLSIALFGIGIGSGVVAPSFALPNQLTPDYAAMIARINRNH